LPEPFDIAQGERINTLILMKPSPLVVSLAWPELKQAVSTLS
jgi:hypothetical protein